MNQKIVRKKYPRTTISDTIQQLDGFQYDTSLDLNNVCCIIKLLPKFHDPTAVVTEIGKFRYNRVLMGIWATSDIFKAELDKIIGDTQGQSKRIFMIYWYLAKRVSPNI